MNLQAAKKNAAEEAVKLVKNGMIVGLGTGSTARLAVDLLGEKISDKFQIIGMPTSIETKKQAENLGIKLIEIEQEEVIDIAIDGADEVSPKLDLIKGLGGALLREKIVEKKAKELVIIVDETKLVENLGEGALPVEVSLDSHELTAKQIERCGCKAVLRTEENGKPFITDNKNIIYHCYFKNKIVEPKVTNKKLKGITGVVDTGLFVGMATRVIVGTEKGTREL